MKLLNKCFKVYFIFGIMKPHLLGIVFFSSKIWQIFERFCLGNLSVVVYVLRYILISQINRSYALQVYECWSNICLQGSIRLNYAHSVWALKLSEIFFLSHYITQQGVKGSDHIHMIFSK